jgi:mannose-6-phosphate isomerase
MAAQPDAQLVVGWTRDTSRAECERRIAEGTLAQILRKVPVKAGDSVYVPAGLVHAIGPGVTVFETQQASDITYRLFDWNRKGLDGNPRELQVNKAADVLEYRADVRATLQQLAYCFNGIQRIALIADPRFTVERIVATSAPAAIATNGRPLVLMSLELPMDISCGGTSVMLEKYQTVLIPATAGSCAISSNGTNADFLFVSPERASNQLASRLLGAGVSQAKVDEFTKQFQS